MSFKATLQRSVAVGALIALVAGASAEAAPAKHHHRHGRQAAAPAESVRAEVAELRAEVAELNARLSAQAGATQQAQSQAADASARASAAQAAASSNETTIARIPAEVHEEIVHSTPHPKSGWWDNTSISGRMYFDLSDVSQKTNTGNPATTGRVSPSGVGFDLKRFYVGIDHKFNDTYSANLTMDEQYSSALNATEFFVKKAYLQAAYSPMLTVRLGAADMPWIPFAEDVYGYRYVEPTLTDRTKFGNSSDWGVHVLGKFDDGHFGYQLSVVNGAGYKVPGIAGANAGNGNLRAKGVDVEGRVNASFGPFVLAVGGYEGKLGKNYQVAPGGVPLTLHEATRVNALAAFVNPQFRVGVEVFEAKNWGVTSANKADGYSGFASWNFAPKMSVFGRYDYVKPAKTSTPSEKDGYFNVGLSYEPVKIVDLSLVYKRDKVENGALSTANGTIGGAVSGSYDEFGLFGQVRW